MAKYVYLTTGGGAEAWVKDGHFECLRKGDSPHKYDHKKDGLVAARHYRLNEMLRLNGGDLITMKFDAKPPYKYHGLVT